MNKNKYLQAFVVLVVLQLSVPLYMIWQRENVLQNGILLKFKTAPVDPVDPFKGRYVKLRYADELVFYETRQNLKPNEKVYVYLKSDNDGFAHLDTVSQGLLPDRHLYVNAYVNYVMKYEGKIALYYPFDRYYMNEFKTRTTEKQLTMNTRSTYALIKIKNGVGVITGLISN